MTTPWGYNWAYYEYFGFPHWMHYPSCTLWAIAYYQGGPWPVQTVGCSPSSMVGVIYTTVVVVRRQGTVGLLTQDSYISS